MYESKSETTKADFLDYLFKSAIQQANNRNYSELELVLKTDFYQKCLSYCTLSFSKEDSIRLLKRLYNLYITHNSPADYAIQQCYTSWWFKKRSSVLTICLDQLMVELLSNLPSLMLNLCVLEQA